MSNYYNYNFISPDNVYTLVKEELRSYFDTQAVDDLLFPIWTERCLKRLGKSSYKIKEAIFRIEDFIQKLPSDFHSVREAWLCTDIGQVTYRQGGAEYAEVTEKMFKMWEGVDFSCSPCDTCEFPDMITAVYKKQVSQTFTFKKAFLLKPGNIAVKDQCSLDCLNLASTSPDEFDIRDNKFVTNFREGTVYLIYYALETDDQGVQLVPDNFRVLEYIEKFLKYKIFEQLSNTITDETAKQIESKMMFYKQEADEAFILAELETKKETVWKKMEAIKRSYNRNNKYQIRNRHGYNPHPRRTRY